MVGTPPVVSAAAVHNSNNSRLSATRSSSSPRSAVSSPSVVLTRTPYRSTPPPASSLHHHRGSTPDSDSPGRTTTSSSRIPKKSLSTTTVPSKESSPRPRSSTSRSVQSEKSLVQTDRIARSVTLSSSHVENKTATTVPHSQLLTNGTAEKYNGLYDTRLNRQRESLVINGNTHCVTESSMNRNLTGSERSVHHHHNHHQHSSATTINSPTATTASVTTTNTVNDSVITTASHVDQVALPELIVETPVLTKPILKKKSIDDSHSSLLPLQHSTCKPVSILKRKTSQEEGAVVSSQPVTFSPSVVEPSAGRRQGILKKHRSLDEAEVTRRRSCSPDVDATEFKPILKNQRRSSLEESSRGRTQSPEPQSILKRKSSREESEEQLNSNEPQGILKRKSSSGSSGTPVHITIADSVILAISGSQEHQQVEEHVKPILKKKSSSCEEPTILVDSGPVETPRPILKKKSSSETDDTEEKAPKKPILKSRRDQTGLSNFSRLLEGRSSVDNIDNVRLLQDKILKSNNGVGEEDEDVIVVEMEKNEDVVHRVPKMLIDTNAVIMRRASDSFRFRTSDSDVRPRRPLSVAERVMNMENFLAMEAAEVRRGRSMSPEKSSLDGTGAVPKRSRDRERFRTQPVTVKEFSNTKHWPNQHEELISKFSQLKKNDVVKKESLMSSSYTSGEMSEVHNKLSRSESVSAKASLFTQLESQMKKAAEEVKAKNTVKGSSVVRRLKIDQTSRFATQPVTQDEVEEAKRQSGANKAGGDDEDQNDPSKLSLAERVSLFNEKIVTKTQAPPPLPRQHRSSARFKTQPVTNEEVYTAQKIAPPISKAASGILVAGILKNLSEKSGRSPVKLKPHKSSDESDKSDEEQLSPLSKRGILKSSSESHKDIQKATRLSNHKDVDSSGIRHLKSVLKKDNDMSVKKDTTVVSSSSSSGLHSILKMSKSKEGKDDDKEVNSSQSESEESESGSDMDKPNKNSDLVSLLHKVEAQARGEKLKKEEMNQRRNSALLDSNKKLEDSDKLMNLKNLDQGKENCEGNRGSRVRKKRGTDGSDTSEGDTSSSGGREVRRIIANDAVARRRQAALNKQAIERH